MPLNKIPLRRQQEIVDMVDVVTLQTGMTYPQYGLKKIVETAIPGVLMREDGFGGNEHIKGAIFKKSADYDQPVIAIQANQPKKAKNFALAHEFGHYVLDHNPDSNYLIDT